MNRIRDSPESLRTWIDLAWPERFRKLSGTDKYRLPLEGVWQFMEW